MAALQQYFYDAQIERFLAQFIRMLSGFQVEFGQDRVGNTTLQRVPIYYGDGSRQVAAIINNMSENAMPTVPAMTVYINNVTYDRDRVQQPDFVGKMNIRQRYYNEDTQEYEARQGNAFSIERLMPVPYTLELKLDIWTSNTKQKLQLLEQLIVLFNPALEIQSTDNYVDWTSLTAVYLETPNWSSRSVPIGTENPIDVATLTFKLPVWISPPAKVKKLGVIERVIANMYDSNGDLNDALLNSDLLMGTRQVITPFNWAVVLIGNKLQCLQQQDTVSEPGNDELAAPVIVPNSNLLWPAVIDIYGVLRPGVSQIRLIQEDETEVVGTIALDPNDDRFVLFDVDTDTTPQNTLDPIDAVINPLMSGPSDGLDSALAGQRYLLTEDTGDADNQAPAVAWVGANGRPLIAKANDIIEYADNYWQVVFRSAGAGGGQYVSNITTGIQYEWTGESWIKSYQGVYPGGTWRLVL